MALAIAVAGMPAMAQNDPTAFMDRVGSLPVTCSGKLDCDQKWAKALQWVLDTPGFKIQIANEMLIQTFGPNNAIHATAFTITKVPTGVDAYTFNWSATCTAQPFCGQSPKDYRFTFVTAVLGSDIAAALKAQK